MNSQFLFQGSVRELAEKLARRDAEIERQGDKISKLGEEMRVKETEIKTTNEQIKKLTHHLPGLAPNAELKCFCNAFALKCFCFCWNASAYLVPYGLL